MKNLTLLFLTVTIAFFSSEAYSQTAGDNIVDVGWLHIAPQGSGDNLKVAGSVVPDTGSSIDNSDTLGLTFTHYVFTNIAVEAIVGAPPKFKLTGTGILSDPAINPLGNVKQWSPALLLKYSLGKESSKWHASVGLGVSHMWYTNVNINPAFESLLSQKISGGATSALPTKVHVDDAWSPVLNAGLTYQIDKHWSAGLSISYLPASTTAALSTTLPNGSVVHSEEKIHLNPIITFASIGYRF